MSDTTGGTEQDLKDAENALIAAGDPALALAMRRHTEAIRNMMMVVVVPSFERAVGSLIKLEIAPVLALLEANALEMGKLATAVRGVSRRVSKLETRMDVSEADSADMRNQLVQLAVVLAARPAQRELEHRAIVDEVVQRLEAGRDDAS